MMSNGADCVPTRLWRPWRTGPAAVTGAGGVLAGRAADEIKLVGDIDQLARGQLPTALGQPVGQVCRFHPVVAIPQRVLDRVKDAAQEVSLIARVVPIRAGAYDPV